MATTAEIDKYVTELRQRTIDRLTLRFAGDEWRPPAAPPKKERRKENPKERREDEAPFKASKRKKRAR